MNMFYSHWLLSKKGPLGTIWVAAHCRKKLKKDQVKHTNISSSVDKILLDEVPIVTYRILAFLLLGVVRIYSKKVEYLFHDCRHVLTKISDFAISKKANDHLEALRAPYPSITLPESFELDAFNLEGLEELNRANVRQCEDVVLEDAWKSEEIGLASFDKYHFVEDAEAYSTDYTLVKDVHSPHFMDDDAVSPAYILTNLEASMEKLCGNRFFLEERLDPMMLDEGEEEPDSVRPFGEEYHTEMDVGVEEEPPDLVKSFDEEQQTDAEEIKFQEMTTPESQKCLITEDHPMSITIDVTRDSKFPDASVATTPELAVRTPATKERARVSRKQTCLFDDIMIFPNKVLKQCIKDSSNLVCKRRKVPHTALHVWKAHLISNLPQSFLEPLIPCISLDLRPLICKMQLKTAEPVETVKIPANTDVVQSPSTQRSPDHTAVAPSTPVAQPTSLRSHEVCGITHSGTVGPASSFEGTEQGQSSIEDQELDVSLMNEEINSCEGDSQEEYKWSVRTRIVARYLLSNFLNRKKRKEAEVVNLSHVLKGKIKKESARLFYEILILKTGGYIDVKQDNAYDDILMLETLKLTRSCDVDGGGVGWR